ncbi:hypothetical protein PMAYCL1PPCAC_27799, partial [Pristionchus mayeri]
NAYKHFSDCSFYSRTSARFWRVNGHSFEWILDFLKKDFHLRLESELLYKLHFDSTSIPFWCTTWTGVRALENQHLPKIEETCQG